MANRFSDATPPAIFRTKKDTQLLGGYAVMKNIIYLSLALLLTTVIVIAQSPAANQKIKTGYVDVGKCKLYYEEQGQGKPLILFHGGFLDRRMWDDQFDIFAKNYRVIRYDARNHGNSVCEPDTFAHFHDLNAFMDGLKIPKATIIGLSLGGLVAIDFALAHPEKIDALVLLGPGLSGYDFKDSAYLADAKIASEAQSIDPWIDIMMKYWAIGPHRTEAQVDSAFANKARMMYTHSLGLWREGNVEKEISPQAIGRLSEIHAPTLLILADLDMPSIHEIGAMIMKDVKGARKVDIKGAAHLVCMEKPQEVNKAILDFLSTQRDK